MPIVGSRLIPGLLLGLLGTSVHAHAQAVGASTTGGEALRVFMDCRSRFCDFDHFRREITFVNYVRDRRDAQVHVLVTTRRTGGGGQEFTIAYIGRGEFADVDDSLAYFSSDTDTFDEVREALTRTIKLGLVRYAARLPMARRLDVTYLPPDTLAFTPQVVEDPWDFWIFRVRVGGDIGGEERQRSFASHMSISGNRTTEEWKVRLFVNGWYAEDRFELADGTEITSISRNYGGGGFVAKSLTGHWSLAASVEARTSTFQNHDLALDVASGLEYNLFPYSESTRRELTFTYAVLARYFNYAEITIFDRMAETRPAQLLEISYTVRQPFGSVNVTLEGSNFLDAFAQHRLDLRSRLNVRLVRGLELNLHGSFARIKDQIFLPREGASDEEVLLRRRELGTAFRYSASISLSYTFGSIYNNIVNPRFE